MMLPIWSCVNARSLRTMGMSGAMPNQPKKQTKKVIHVMWKARMGADLKSNRLILVALEEVGRDDMIYVFITYQIT